MVWSQSDRVVQMLQPVGLIEQVVVVEVELYSLAVQGVQMVVVVVVVVVVEVKYSHAGCSSKSTMVGLDAYQSSVLVPTWHLEEMPWYR